MILKATGAAAAAALVFALGPAGCGGGPAAPRTAVVPADAMAAPARGELLYLNACAACHSKQTHWRGRHRVKDWPALVEQVTQWQSIAGQAWSREEIEDVAAYLNRRFYELPCPLPRCAAGTVG
jgi:mono/diheme cytochrome c family protein